MATITVTPAGGDTFHVEVSGDGESTTTHEVVVTDRALAQFAASREKADLVRASFEFLLEREPRTSILAQFELPVIARYFPDYPDRISSYLYP